MIDSAAMDLLRRLAWYYEVNDCGERPADDAMEVPIRDLREAHKIVTEAGEKPAPF